MIESSNHQAFMLRAIELGRTNLGQTWPNPAVGAVVVKDGKIVGEGFTARGGRPHAEPQALAKAGEVARGATLYVSLEPCAHQGKTPPCTDAIISAGIARVVVACRDPNPPVNGKGIAQLQAAGIEVTENICSAEARALNRGFISVVERKRPYVMMKVATSADGKIAGGSERWITGETARAEVHRLRSEYDAILTGIGTVLADDPLLTVRTPGMEHKSPMRIVLDRSHRLPRGSRLSKSIDVSALWVLGSKTIPEALSTMAEKGITRVMVEAGQKLNTSMLESGLVDTIYWFQAPHVIGEQGLSVFTDHNITNPSLLTGWQCCSETEYSPDHLYVLEPKANTI
ncbi:MAG: bifunctional diaminohydroxyphosphoribosylaminopyrimidine deaminase/5-amino-6-(5-phosphoribosylamino)uracil reductase RibD [Rickettsiales bacterium]|jgi:diaminohydroxyphosphoribosylaminopyrimidine deaminase/5-amino-6-(5-phosphoribosylamino)uracil reductase|nr:bifunctional diaminohydroxyphosphoribosylaminopyrimidine deaminase/5-amino-6-(5-phosphoribosylamino)uracil reductase RibD [Rickettsiales bacterium]